MKGADGVFWVALKAKTLFQSQWHHYDFMLSKDLLKCNSNLLIKLKLSLSRNQTPSLCISWQIWKLTILPSWLKYIYKKMFLLKQPLHCELLWSLEKREVIFLHNPRLKVISPYVITASLWRFYPIKYFNPISWFHITHLSFMVLVLKSKVIFAKDLSSTWNYSHFMKFIDMKPRKLLKK